MQQCCAGAVEMDADAEQPGRLPGHATGMWPPEPCRDWLHGARVAALSGLHNVHLTVDSPLHAVLHTCTGSRTKQTR